MEFHPEITDKDIKEVHKHYERRLALYREKGLDFGEFRRTLLDNLGPAGGDMLELGTGTGYTALTLAKAGYKFTSIDTDEHALRTTASRLAHDNVLANVRFHVMDATRLDFADASFDSVIAINVLHHVREVEKLLAETDRVLRESGRLIIADFNEKGRKIIDDMHKAEGGSHDHHPSADKERISSYLESSGYSVTDVEDPHHWLLVGVKG